MNVTLKCGCTIDDERKSTVHEADGKHYPLGTSPKTFCAKCDLYKPCLCAASDEETLPLPTGPRPDPNVIAWIMSGMPKVGRLTIDIHVYDGLRAEINALREEMKRKDAALGLIAGSFDWYGRNSGEDHSDCIYIAKAALGQGEHWRLTAALRAQKKE